MLNSRLKKLIPTVILILAILFVFIFFVREVADVSNTHSQQAKENLELALTRAAVACYANEGSYPESIEYLEENYAVQINRNRFDVFYEVFAQNLMPDITVVEKK